MFIFIFFQRKICLMCDVGAIDIIYVMWAEASKSIKNTWEL